MVSINIHVPRPFLTLMLIGGAFVVLTQTNAGASFMGAIGGSGGTQAQTVFDAEQNVKRVREEQEVLSRREHILREELATLEQEGRYIRDEDARAQLDETRRRLIALMQDKHVAEQEILASLHQIWEAQGYAMQASQSDGISANFIQLTWPVEPELGISAHFDDDGYKAHFGMEHHAIDIPVAQGSIVGAAADGVVSKVTDNGMGFSSLIIRHDGGFATLYGHVSGFLVQEGQHVRAGDPVALSGGQPGTKGAGRMTTGSHLHLELLKNGIQVDPLNYLPSL